jgi:hypothetical protein
VFFKKVVKLSKILFLNEENIFDEKIRCFDLKNYFEDYNGKTCDPEDGKKFIINKFLDAGKQQTLIYHNITGLSSLL